MSAQPLSFPQVVARAMHYLHEAEEAIGAEDERVAQGQPPQVSAGEHALLHAIVGAGYAALSRVELAASDPGVISGLDLTRLAESATYDRR